VGGHSKRPSACGRAARIVKGASPEGGLAGRQAARAAQAAQRWAFRPNSCTAAPPPACPLRIQPPAPRPQHPAAGGPAAAAHECEQACPPFRRRAPGKVAGMSGVQMGPGATALMRMPFCTPSGASERVMAICRKGEGGSEARGKAILRRASGQGAEAKGRERGGVRCWGGWEPALA
jgi:hypothetical protein